MQNNSQEKEVRLPLVSLWQREDKNGNMYFTGTLNNLPVKVFANRNKQNDKSPDFYMFLCEKFKKDEDKTLAPEGAQASDFDAW